jgi:hypothetical protein
MQDDAWKEARAASEYEEWEASLDLEGKAPGTVQDYAYTYPEDFADWMTGIWLSARSPS